jgi:5-methylcytosine-specific restriction endonuclease McrA
MSRAVPEWIGKTDDAAIPARVKDRIAQRSSDCCVKCTRKVGGALRAEFDHATPLILGGEHRESNLQLLCHECHRAKSSVDVKIKAKVARVRKKLVLGERKRTSFRGWRKMNGDIVFAKGVRNDGSGNHRA